MLSSKDNKQNEYSCSQCHQIMANTEMLQIHLQTVHKKQSSTNLKGFFSVVKQKIKPIQDDSKSLNEPVKIYAQYFAFNETYSTIGYLRSLDDYFQKVRNSRNDYLIPLTRQTLLSMELLTNINEHIPRNGNSKERLKYEQNLVQWMDDSISLKCSSCEKSFGFFGRKHHCRLDGKTICTQCSQFLCFSHARWLIELNASSSLQITERIRQQLDNLLQITLSIISNDDTNEEYLRICLPCARFLQRNYDKIRFRHMEKDELFHHYEKLIQIKIECEQIHPTYSIIIDSIWNGETNYHLQDAQRLYEQLRMKYDKINSISELIAKLPVLDAENDRRYNVLCRNIRTYSLQIFQRFSSQTKRVPTNESFKRMCDEREMKLALNLTQQLRTIDRQNSHVIHFVRGEDSIDGNNDTIVLGDLR